MLTQRFAPTIGREALLILLALIALTIGLAGGWAARGLANPAAAPAAPATNGAVVTAPAGDPGAPGSEFTIPYRTGSGEAPDQCLRMGGPLC